MDRLYVLTAIFVFGATSHLAAQDAVEIDFSRDIRPILSDTCYRCHGPDEEQLQADLRLDSRENVFADRDGYSILAAGDLKKSELWNRISSDDPDVKMPPEDAPRQLTAQQRDLIKRWIQQGANWQDHWSFEPIADVALPKTSSPAWTRTAIDNFILKQLDQAGLTPASIASKETLIRRVTLDLTGLPPTQAEVDTFLADQSPDAYERLVDRLLESPRYGERQALAWLDAARFADTSGYQTDGIRHQWRWREWVIDSFNTNKPFNEFTIEQLAGDLIPDATPDQLLATGFNRNHRANSEGGIVFEEYLVEYAVDRVDTTATVWLGLTMQCARCHDHKYDPISQVEYYRLFAFFNNADEPRIEAPTNEILFQRENIKIKIKTLESKLRELNKNNQRKSLEAEIANLKNTQPKAPTTLVMAKRKQPRITRRFIQGDFTMPAEEVQPGTPAILHALSNQRKDRLGFAQWVANQNNPLLARVAVNRMWQHLFGKGIVQTENDFGSQGIPPTHPKLLDWLSVEFMENGWSQKNILRLLVNSATYKQASFRKKKIEKDPTNKWLARQSRLRLDAELVRDVALNASGLLSPKMGGPGVFPPQPDGCMDLGQHRKTWSSSKGEDRYRRAVYTYRWRNTPHPALKVFDAPDGLSACTRRIRSNTPLQALTMMNDPAFIELAILLSKRLIAEASTTTERICLGFQLCLNRNPNSEELHLLTELVEQQSKEFTKNVNESKALVELATAINKNSKSIENNAEFSAWTMAARVLLNLDETITRE